MTPYRDEAAWWEDDDGYRPSPINDRSKNGKMPVGSEAKARAAGKRTHGSKVAGKRVAKAGGIKNRRRKS